MKKKRLFYPIVHHLFKEKGQKSANIHTLEKILHPRKKPNTLVKANTLVFSCNSMSDLEWKLPETGSGRSLKRDDYENRKK